MDTMGSFPEGKVVRE